MIKLVIFDLDGTLVNAYPAVAKSVDYTLKVLGLSSPSYVQIKRSVGGGDRRLMAKFVGNKLADKALVIYRPHHTKALRGKGMVRLLPGALEILKFLKSKGIKLAIASNRPAQFTRIILKALGVLKFFDGVLCAGGSVKPKPNPGILWAIARSLGVEKSKVLYVGDMTIDVECARAAGIRMVAVSTGSSSKKELKSLKPWRIIGKISALKFLRGAYE